MRYLRSSRLGGPLLALIAVLALALAGCSNDESGSSGPTSSTAKVEVSKVDEIAALLPPDIAQSGKLVIGVNVPYQPNEYRDASGKIVGFDVDLMDAVTGVLGLTPEYREADFDKIIPAIQQGTFNVGMSSFTDNKEREKQVDFVTYFSAGVQWAQQAGGSIDPNNACGKRVAVQSTTYEDTEEIPAKSKACTDAGKPAIEKLKFESQDEATNALVLGKVDAMSADSPVTAYAIKRSNGALEPAGPIADSAPYGYPIVKGSELGPALQKAVQYLIDNGQYQQIAENWGVEAGTIPTSVINGAVS
ncbi:ABC transporter substrate-binding protein [Gordonia rhizosphera]|uniref:Putative amino acid ABC transporter substrate-binding protein n=1 Tax=Gordonia rhizosphera NBRC 16068 TaxID=1108045 RepID=K6WIW8_9ACTN|nr:ABC transporter substrate-binding protein [Gordonia rhizosphera]GAB92112.1 putative amino acid ABC transporter substrate-binding protein [Gordonia rhizosphera NBRC 16068]